MVSKNNQQLIAQQNRNEHQRFALKKLHVGVVSVLVGVSFAVYGGQVTAHADSAQPQASDLVTDAKGTDAGQVQLKDPAVVENQAITDPAPAESTEEGPVVAATQAPVAQAATATEQNASQPVVSDQEVATDNGQEAGALNVALFARGRGQHRGQGKGQAPVDEWTLQAARENAQEAINDLRDRTTAGINAAQNLSEKDRAKLSWQVGKTADQANDGIAKAKTLEKVASTTSHGMDKIKRIFDVDQVVDTKAVDTSAANQAIDDALNAKLEEIDVAADLTTEERQALVDEANEAAEDAKKNIADAKTKEEVADAKDAGIERIQGIQVPSESAVKAAADEAIDEALNAKLEEIADAKNLTTEERQVLADEANEAAEDAKKNIAEATTGQQVIDAGNAGVAKIHGIQVPSGSAVKSAADQMIDEALNAKLEEIAGAKNLTSDEKQTLTDQAKQVAEDAKKNIADAKTNEEVGTAKNAGVDKINEVQVPVDSDNEEVVDSDKLGDGDDSGVDSSATGSEATPSDSNSGDSDSASNGSENESTAPIDGSDSTATSETGSSSAGAPNSSSASNGSESESAGSSNGSDSSASPEDGSSSER